MARTREDGEQSREVPAPTLTVAAVARRLGVAPSTLRTWDRRYGLGPSEHTAGSHRRYSAADLTRLVVMRRLTLEGVTPAEAAQIARTAPEDYRGGPGVAPVLPLLGAQRPDPVRPADLAPPDLAPPDLVRPGLLDAGPAARRARASGWPGPPTEADRSRGGGGRVIALPEGSPAARGLARAAMALDSHEVTRLVRESVRANGVVRTWDTMAMPVLVAIADRWSVTGEGVDVEHALSECLVGVFRGVAASLQRPGNVRPVMLGCAEGDHHTLPLHVLAAALAEEGIGCRMFGVGMPAEALLSAVRRSGPSVVFLYARMEVDEAAVLNDIPRQRPTPRVVLGGPGWDSHALPRSAVAVASLGEAVDEIVSAAGL